MNRKILITLIVLAVMLAAGIAIAIFHLYSDPGRPATAMESDRFTAEHALTKAIPSDAAIVLSVKNFERACSLLGDSTAVFNQLTSCKFDQIARESFPALRKCPAMISIHYSKDMPPLLVVEAGPAASDSIGDCAKLIKVAESSGLYAKKNGGLVLISSSETIISSSIRHMAEGHSILESSGFTELASKVAGEDILFVSNAYSGNLMEVYVAKKHRKRSGFFREIAKWTAFTITKHSADGIAMHGRLLYDHEASYYMNVLRHAGTAASTIAEAVPAQTAFIISLPIGNITSYIKAYRNYLDAKASLDKYESVLSRQRKENGQHAEEWAKSLNIKEISIAGIHFGSKLRQVLLIKPEKAGTMEGVSGYSYAGYAKTLFGEIFTGEDEAACTLVKGWIVAGARDCMEEYSKGGFMAETLQERLGSNGLSSLIPQKGCGFWMYHSLSEDPTLIDANFSPLMATGLRNMLKGVTFVPATLAALSENDKMVLELRVDRTNISKSKAPAMDRDTTVIIPDGPFKVKNSGTGKLNTFYQNRHLSLCLQDENGKDLWGIPFKYPICGFVEGIDYYNNGKIQYLFAADGKLYLIDRLGRFVSGFPADLGKKIVLGPAVYDFSGAKGYTAMVLHGDNTIGYYDLHGKAVDGWKGIKPEATIKSLPELLEWKGAKYWIIRTSIQAMVYPFNGGDPVVKGNGDKMIRPDSKIEINENGSIEAKCYDGKERTFKLEK